MGGEIISGLYNLGRLSIKVRDGKGGKTAMVYISEEAAETLHEYLAIRPDLEIKGQRPLFYTDYGAWYDRKEI